MDKDFPFSLVTPQGTLFQGDVRRVTLMSAAGSFSVLAHHAPLVASLPQQIAQWQDNHGLHSFSLGSALAEVSQKGLSILASHAELT